MTPMVFPCIVAEDIFSKPVQAAPEVAFGAMVYLVFDIPHSRTTEFQNSQ
jgi:hypothetical protein